MPGKRRQGPVDLPVDNVGQPSSRRSGSIEPEPVDRRPQVTVQTSALVDDLGAMYFQVYDDEISFYFGEKDDQILITFTDRSLMNLAVLVNRAVRATLEARGVPMAEALLPDSDLQRVTRCSVIASLVLTERAGPGSSAAGAEPPAAQWDAGLVSDHLSSNCLLRTLSGAGLTQTPTRRVPHDQSRSLTPGDEDCKRPTGASGLSAR